MAKHWTQELRPMTHSEYQEETEMILAAQRYDEEAIMRDMEALIESGATMEEAEDAVVGICDDNYLSRG